TAQTAAKDTPAAERTRGKLLKSKITVNFNGTLRDLLKELAAQAEMEHGKPVMWTYGDEVKPNQAVAFECQNKPLDEVLDALFKKPGLGYVVVSQDDDRRDGWVRVTVGEERGFAKGTPAPKTPAPGTEADEDEKLAATKLATAKELIAGGKGATAKPLLTLIVKRYPTTKAGKEAKELLEKMDK
ncbi:MAG TPA: STN domain-containing protein, partial [Gemmataceae bacterium]|nr:STN domain-containing protein [Gemmataceae bacterium]